MKESWLKLKLVITEIPQQYEWIKDYLPNKIILFKKDDLRNIFR